MEEEELDETTQMEEPLKNQIAIATTPLIFISHDSRDKDLADAFSQFLKSVSGSMIKTFQSTDKAPGEGIEFGTEWYGRIVSKLEATSDVVCIFTERSIDRPWILFEAGLAKGMLRGPVIGLALGIPLSRITNGPFYQFQNMEDSEEDLTKLVHQLASRVPGLVPDAAVIKGTIETFKASSANILEARANASAVQTAPTSVKETSIAQVVEEMKILPSLVAERLAEMGRDVPGKGSSRHSVRMVLGSMVRADIFRNPFLLVAAAGFIRNDAPWLYEIALRAYDAITSEKLATVTSEMKKIRKEIEAISDAGLTEGFFIDSPERMDLIRELPYMIEQSLKIHTDKLRLENASQKVRKAGKSIRLD